MATWGGTTTRLAKRPPIIPKFERVIVAPRSSSGGIERAAASARIRLRPARKSALSRSPTLRSTGTKSPPSRSTAMPTSTRLSKWRSPASALYQAFREGSALHAAAIACTTNRDVSFLRPSLDIGLINHRRRNHLRVGQCHSMRHGAPHTFERLGRTGLGQATRRTFDIGSRNHPAGTAALDEVEINIELARQSPNCRKHLQPAWSRGRLGLARLRFAALNYADDSAGVRFSSLAKLDQRGTDLDQIAFGAESSRNSSAPRRGYLHDGLVGLHRHQRLIGDDMIALVHQPSHDFGLFETLAKIGQSELTRHAIQLDLRKLAGLADRGSNA